MSGEEAFLQQKIHEHYARTRATQPPDIARREFGFGTFGRKIAGRHLAFADYDAFSRFLAQSAPFYVSYSSARYDRPAATPMNQKGVRGTDLTFEFDVGDLKTDCADGHTVWTCKDPACTGAGKGNVHYCTRCGEATKLTGYVCPACMDAVKAQTRTLLSGLRDLGLDDGLALNYSGARGLHIHVRGESVWDIPSSGRVELLDYLSATNPDFSAMGFSFEEKNPVAPKFARTSGLCLRIFSRALSYLEDATPMDLHARTTLSLREAEKLLDQRREVIGELHTGFLRRAARTKNHEFWKSFFEAMRAQIEIQLDRMVTMDMARIMRVPDTLHGGTLLLSKSVALDALDAFDPLKDAVAFSKEKTLKVHVENAPRHYLGGRWFDAMRDTDEELPEFSALYLLAKGAARLVEK